MQFLFAPDCNYISVFSHYLLRRHSHYLLVISCHRFYSYQTYGCVSDCSTSFYYFLSSGLDSVGHSEVAVLLEIDDNDNSLPMQVFNLYTHLFNAARKGKAIQANDFLPIEDL